MELNQTEMRAVVALIEDDLGCFLEHWDVIRDGIVNYEEYWNEITLGLKLTSIDGLADGIDDLSIDTLASLTIFSDGCDYDGSQMCDDIMIITLDGTTLTIDNFSKSVPALCGGELFHYLGAIDISQYDLPKIVVMEHSQWEEILKDSLAQW